MLSCRDCNRGPNGKFARIPVERLVARLSTRNEFLIASQHPLKETLTTQTGGSEAIRTEFLRDFHQRARNALLQPWKAEEKARPHFDRLRCDHSPATNFHAGKASRHGVTQTY